MSIVACAWTDLRPATREAIELNANGREVLFRDCRGRTDAYWEFLDELWQAGCDFTVIEHDIVIHSAVLDGFDRCPEPWCAHLYELAVGYRPALGCTRFRHQLLEAEPDALVEAAKGDNSQVPGRAWWRIDVRLDQVLRDRGYLPHIHQPNVGHLNPVQKLAHP